MNASTVDQDIDAASHGVQSLLKEAPYGIKVVQIASNKLCCGTLALDGIDGVDSGKVQWRIVLRLTKDETKRGTRFGKCDRTCGADALVEI